MEKASLIHKGHKIQWDLLWTTFCEWSLEWKLRVAKTQEAAVSWIWMQAEASNVNCNFTANRARESRADQLTCTSQLPTVSFKSSEIYIPSWSAASIFRLNELTAAQLQHGVNMIPLSKLLHCNASLTLPPTVSQPALTGSTFSTVSLHHRPKLPSHWGQNTVAHTPPRCEWELRKGICRQNSGA